MVEFEASSSGRFCSNWWEPVGRSDLRKEVGGLAGCQGRRGISMTKGWTEGSACQCCKVEADQSGTKKKAHPLHFGDRILLVNLDLELSNESNSSFTDNSSARITSPVVWYRDWVRCNHHHQLTTTRIIITSTRFWSRSRLEVSAPKGGIAVVAASGQ